MSVKVSVNSKRARERINRIALLKQKKVSDAVKGVGEEMATDAKRGAPVDTGRLRSSIHVETIGKNSTSFQYSDRQGNVYDGKLRTTPDDRFEAVVGSNVRYAQEQEEEHKTNAGFFASARDTARLKLIKELNDIF